MALFGKGKATDPVALLKSGDFKGAIKLLEKKLQQSPGDFTTRLRLAEAHEGAGHREDAARIYREEGEASLAGGGSRAQGIALLRKAVKLLPEDAALAARLASLEGGGAASASGSFSFEIDSGEESVPSEEASSEAPAPEAIELPSAEPAAPDETSVEIPEEAVPAVALEEAVAKEAPVRIAAEVIPPPAVEREPEAVVPDAAIEEVESANRPEAPSAVPAAEEPPGPPPSRLLRPDDPKALMQELFPGLSAQEAGELSATLKSRKLATGEALIREGEMGDSLFLVMAGCLEASSRFQGSSLRLAKLQRCDVIGEVAFLKDVPRTATVLAMEPSVVLELSREAVNRRFEDRPELLGRLEAILEERVQKTIQAVKKRWKGD